MRRRAFLASAGSALLAGCVGSVSSVVAPGGTTGEFDASGFEASTTKTVPPKRYFLGVTDTYSTEGVEDEPGEQTIRDVSEIDDPAQRAVVEDVLTGDALWREEIPQGLRRLTERVDFFTWEANTAPDDTYTHWGIEVDRTYPDREPVVEFAADLLDDRVTPDDPGTIAFSLTNTGDDPRTVFSGTVPPFSILFAEGPGEDDRALLWRDYHFEGCVSYGHGGVMTCDAGALTRIAPGETVEREYDLRPGFGRDALADVGFDAPGRYTVSETLTYYRDEDGDPSTLSPPSTEVDWTVAFDLEEI